VLLLLVTEFVSELLALVDGEHGLYVKSRVVENHFAFFNAGTLLHLFDLATELLSCNLKRFSSFFS